MQTRTVKEFFKHNDFNPTLEELRSGLTEEFLKVVRKGLKLQNGWLDNRLNMDEETYLALPDSTKNSDARTAGLLTGINKDKADSEQRKAAITIDHIHHLRVKNEDLQEELKAIQARISMFNHTKQNDAVLDVDCEPVTDTSHTQLGVTTTETPIR